MKRTPLKALLPLALAATVGGGLPSAVAEDCVGLDVLRVCVHNDPGTLPSVDPNGWSYDECVYLGGSSCTPVSVPLPSVGLGGGGSTTVTCYYRGDENCFDQIPRPL